MWGVAGAPIAMSKLATNKMICDYVWSLTAFAILSAAKS